MARSIQSQMEEAHTKGVGYIDARYRFVINPAKAGKIGKSGERQRQKLLDLVYAHDLDWATIEGEISELLDGGKPEEYIVEKFVFEASGKGELTKTEARKMEATIKRLSKRRPRVRRKGGASKPRAWNHAEWADDLMEEYHVCYIDGTISVWRDGSYQLGRDNLLRAMVDKWAGIKQHQRREVECYLALRAPRYLQTEETDMLIAFTNGVLDLRTMKVQENVPELRVPNVIPHRWNPGTACGDVDDAIKAWACDNRDTMRLIGETIGLAMYRGRVQQSPYVEGPGGSGKSTFMEMLIRAVGRENVASLDISHIGRRFQSTALMGKVANIADDVSLESISKEEFSVIKRCVTKDTIEYEVKGGETGMFRPYATQIFAGNALPRFPEAGRQTTRRFVVVPFNNDFTGMGKGDRTKVRESMESRLHTEAAMERFIEIGIHALIDMLRRGGTMTELSDASERRREMLMAASSVAAFAYEVLGLESEKPECIVGERTEDVYMRYKEYCTEAGRRQVARNNFSNELCDIMRLDTRRARHPHPSGGTRLAATFVSRGA